MGRAYGSPASAQQRQLDAVAEQRLELRSRRWDSRRCAMPPGPDGPPPPSRNGATRPGDLLASNIPDEIKAGDVLRLYLVYA